MNINLFPLGLGNVADYLLGSWIGPAFVLIVAVLAVTMLIRKQLVAFLSFTLVALIAGVFIFFGGDLFGQNGNLTKVGKDVAKKINVIDLSDTTFTPDFLKIEG